MSTDTVREFSADAKSLGDKIAGLTLKQAIELSDYLKEVHNIEPAAGGAVMMAGPGPGGPAAPVEEKTEFDVILEAFGVKKIDVI
jgi:large subunit ribosomal protein L7/L12